MHKRLWDRKLQGWFWLQKSELLPTYSHFQGLFCPLSDPGRRCFSSSLTVRHEIYWKSSRLLPTTAAPALAKASATVEGLSQLSLHTPPLLPVKVRRPELTKTPGHKNWAGCAETKGLHATDQGWSENRLTVQTHSLHERAAESAISSCVVSSSRLSARYNEEGLNMELKTKEMVAVHEKHIDSMIFFY